MKVALTLLVLAVGFIGSLWLSRRLVLVRPDEDDGQAALRNIRNGLAALGCGFTAMLVMGYWLQDVVQESHAATELALANSRSNCENFVVFQTNYELALIADVRLARTQYTQAVEDFQDRQAGSAQQLPDMSQLPQSVRDFLDPLVERSVADAQADLQRLSAVVDRWQAELEERETTLDKHRAAAVPTSCPPVQDPDIPIPTEDTDP